MVSKFLQIEMFFFQKTICGRKPNNNNIEKNPKEQKPNCER